MNVWFCLLIRSRIKIHCKIKFRGVTHDNAKVTLTEELLTLPEHLSSPPVFSEVRVTRSLVLCVCFVDRCLLLCFFVWPLSWYLQTLLFSCDIL